MHHARFGKLSKCPGAGSACQALFRIPSQLANGGGHYMANPVEGYRQEMGDLFSAVCAAAVAVNQDSAHNN
jgi:hypothetical protein